MRDLHMILAKSGQIGEVEVGAIATELNQVAVIQTSEEEDFIKIQINVCCRIVFDLTRYSDDVAPFDGDVEDSEVLVFVRLHLFRESYGDFHF